MHSPFRLANGIDYDGDEVSCRTQPDRHGNNGGSVHGGLLMTMLDSVMGGAVIAALPPDKTCVTVSLTTSFLNPGRLGERLVARATITRRGTTLSYVDGVITHEDDETPVATATGVFAIIDR